MNILTARWVGFYAVSLVFVSRGCLAAPDHATDYLNYLMAAGRSSAADEDFLRSMGDGMAVALIKNFSEELLGQPKNFDRSLWMISTAFESPASISNAEDRRPRAALFLLGVLERDVGDKKRKARAKALIKRLSDIP